MKPKSKSLPKSRAAARRAICRDVIAQLNAKKIVATRGDYGTVENATCQACALGSMFISVAGTRQLNLAGGDYMRKRLAPYFDERELLDIETAFESYTTYGIGGAGSFDAFRYRGNINLDFYDDEYDDKALRYIMANIIRNGRFEPRDLRGPRAATPYKTAR